MDECTPRGSDSRQERQQLASRTRTPKARNEKRPVNEGPGPSPEAKYTTTIYQHTVTKLTSTTTVFVGQGEPVQGGDGKDPVNETHPDVENIPDLMKHFHKNPSTTPSVSVSADTLPESEEPPPSPMQDKEFPLSLSKTVWFYKEPLPCSSADPHANPGTCLLAGSDTHSPTAADSTTHSHTKSNVPLPVLPEAAVSSTSPLTNKSDTQAGSTDGRATQHHTQNAQPQANQTRQPHAGRTAPPHASQTVQPHAGQTAQPQAGQITQPQANQTMQPQASQTAQPQAGQTMQSQADQTTQPQASQTLQPQAGQTVQPHAGQPFASINSHPSMPSLQAPRLRGLFPHRRHSDPALPARELNPPPHGAVGLTTTPPTEPKTKTTPPTDPKTPPPTDPKTPPPTDPKATPPTDPNPSPPATEDRIFKTNVQITDNSTTTKFQTNDEMTMEEEYDEKKKIRRRFFGTNKASDKSKTDGASNQERMKPETVTVLVIVFLIVLSVLLFLY